MTGFSREPEATAGEIARYLEQHPRASDTVEGVLQWWLKGHEFALPLEHVRTALESLVAKGVATRRTLPDGTIVYGTAGKGTGREHRSN